MTTRMDGSALAASRPERKQESEGLGIIVEDHQAHPVLPRESDARELLAGVGIDQAIRRDTHVQDLAMAQSYALDGVNSFRDAGNILSQINSDYYSLRQRRAEVAIVALQFEPE